MDADAIKLLNYIKEDLGPQIFERVENGNPADLGCSLYMKAYSRVYEIGNRGDDNFLYNEYINLIKDHAKKFSNPQICSSKGKNLIVMIVKSWKKHKILVYWLQIIFHHLDLYYVKNSFLTPIIQAGLQIFKTEVFDSLSKKEICAALIEQIRAEREGNESNYIKKCLNCFSEIQAKEAKVYKHKNQKKIIWEGKPNYEFSERIFGEAELLEETRIYYASKPAGWMSTLLVPENFEEANKIFKAEAEKIQNNENLQNELLKVIAEEIIKRIALSVAETKKTDDIRIFDEDKRDEVKMMFEILKNYETTLQCITTRFKLCIENKGIEIISDEKLQQD